MRKALVLLVLAMAGCGGSKDPALDGTWSIMVNGACGYGLTLDSKAGTYVTNLMCSLQSGGFGADVESGRMDVSQPGKISITPDKASCPDIMHDAETLYYSFDHGHLVLTDPAYGIVAMERAPDSSGTAMIQFGCWMMGTFTQHPLGPIAH